MLSRQQNFEAPNWVDPEEVNAYIIRGRVVIVKRKLSDFMRFAQEANPDIQDDMRKIVVNMLRMIKDSPHTKDVGHLFDNERIWDDWFLPTATLTFNHELELWNIFDDDAMVILPHRYH